MDFNQAYDQNSYLNFLADGFQFKKLFKSIQINNEAVTSFSQLGYITTVDNKKLPVFEIDINPNTQPTKNTYPAITSSQ